MYATSNYQKMDCCRKINGNKIFDVFLNFFDVISIFFRSFFYVLCFYIMPFLYFCYSMFCRSMFRHRSRLSLGRRDSRLFQDQERSLCLFLCRLIRIGHSIFPTWYSHHYGECHLPLTRPHQSYHISYL